ncbi:hypothetical protein ACWCXX_33225 [Streptomyces sp. NPDC001732]
MTKTPEVSAADRDTGIRARIDKAVLDATADLVSAYGLFWPWQDFRLRREALLVRVEVEDLRQPAVAAVGLKLRAA